MNLWIVIPTVLVLGFWAVMGVLHAFGLPKIPRVAMRADEGSETPLVSVLIAAKEEEESIAATMRDLLGQSYSRMELIAVNDRSEDRTGEEMESVKRWAAELGLSATVEVVHIEELPPGWLGKNHAHYVAAKAAKGDILLFTDADVRFHKDTLRSTVHYFLIERADHLTVLPEMIAKSPLLRAFVHFFLFSLGILKPLWRPNDDEQTSLGMGVGAFNMLSRSAYEKIGTHQAIALRPDDDLELGMRVKRAGLRQRLAVGMELLSVEWYPNLKAALIGLEKNLFAGLKYQLWQFFAATAGQLLFFVWPFLAVWLTRGWVQVAYGVTVAIMMLLYLGYVRKLSQYRGYEVWMLPVTAALFVYVLFRSTFLTLRRGGIYWRGTFYSLAELKKMMR